MAFRCGKQSLAAAVHAPHCQSTIARRHFGVRVQFANGDQLLSQFNPTGYVYAGVIDYCLRQRHGVSVIVTPADTAGTQANLDVCFTPMGRTFYRISQTGLLVQMTEVPSSGSDARYGWSYARRRHSTQRAGSNGRIPMTVPTRIKTERFRTLKRGYTIVELMMAIAVFAIGVSGIIAMQKVAAAANQHSRALSLATNIAQAWQDQLSADSSLFNAHLRLYKHGLADVYSSGNNRQAGWKRPTYNQNLGIGAAFDELGTPLADTPGALANTQFCVHIRLTRLYPNSPGIEVVRTEVRVIWPRTQGTMSPTFCSTTMAEATLAADTNNYHFLYQVSAVREQP